MSRLDLGKLWLDRFTRELPDASTRMTTRMAWHLAALGVTTEEELTRLPEVALAKFRGGHRHFIEMRSNYLRRVSSPIQTTREIVRASANAM